MLKSQPDNYRPGSRIPNFIVATSVGFSEGFADNIAGLEKSELNQIVQVGQSWNIRVGKNHYTTTKNYEKNNLGIYLRRKLIKCKKKTNKLICD